MWEALSQKCQDEVKIFTHNQGSIKSLGLPLKNICSALANLKNENFHWLRIINDILYK